ncbi:hypothetical protein AAHB41_02075 [Pediococcus pentosaceus]|uniref:Polyketide cyclase/dehydrase n=2 Tax=Pediococcus pentosaceus TaxID=1255 RepID=A0AAU7NM24_PEDPE|nr:hypothetical protein [Pediococcus pentosaceus]KRN47717.1 hypothetical protein IV86_GL000351 [Pediococcus pentosaceus]MBM9930062.1 hypothetical protein [Pediococcus pentosaceus]MCE5960137.1 hypothetical protein [Pediococcus pentosaceus]MCG7197130.1 hypothetical protein [Pediococcus pentosaceus]MCI2396471.1 hypothetical protein [Pediococcus pentosaceus]
MKKLFINTIFIQSNLERLSTILKSPQNLSKWVPDINSVSPKDDYFLISRSSSALNNFEKISVTSQDNSIIYTSTGGRLEYELHFDLTNKDDKTLVEQTLLVDETLTKLPLTLLAPIAKHAFHENLSSLERLIAIS